MCAVSLGKQVRVVADVFSPLTTEQLTGELAMLNVPCPSMAKSFSWKLSVMNTRKMTVIP